MSYYKLLCRLVEMRSGDSEWWTRIERIYTEYPAWAKVINQSINRFYRAMLCIRGTSHGPVSVSVSVTSRSSTKTAERIELVFGMRASFHPSYTVLKGNSVISKNKGTSLWNFVLNSGLRKFRHGISIVETCYLLSSRKVDAQSVINWTVVRQLSR